MEEFDHRGIYMDMGQRARRVLGIGALLLSFTGCTTNTDGAEYKSSEEVSSTQTPTQPPSSTIHDLYSLTVSGIKNPQAAIIKATFNKFVSEVGCSFTEQNPNERIVVSSATFPVETLEDGSKVTTEAHSSSGLIGLSEATLDSNDGTLGDVMSHELSHACVVPSDNDSVLDVLSSPELKITDITGFNVTPDNAPAGTSIIGLEEGAASLIAASIQFDGSYELENPSYSNWMQLMRQIVTSSGIEINELAKFQQNSDLQGFIERVKNGHGNPELDNNSALLCLLDEARIARNYLGDTFSYLENLDAIYSNTGILSQDHCLR